jgi:hypothetical protein
MHFELFHHFYMKRGKLFIILLKLFFFNFFLLIRKHYLFIYLNVSINNLIEEDTLIKLLYLNFDMLSF